MDAPVPVLEPVLPRKPARTRLIVGVLVLLAIGALLVWLLLVVVRPGAGDPGPRLVVVETDGGIATMDADGESMHRYQLPGVQFQFPAWSPDGSRVAGIGRTGNSVAVTVLDAGTDPTDRPLNLYESTSQPAFYLYWSPDGEDITFLTSESVGIALRVAPTDGSGPAEIVRQAAPFYWDFVDDDRLLVHTGSTGAEAFVGEVALDGGPLETSPPESGLFRAPAVAGGGAARAYVIADGEDPSAAGRIVVETRDGSVHREIPVRGAAAFGFDPTSTRLAFIAPALPSDPPAPIPAGPLQIVDPDTGDVRTLLERNVLAFFWSPDGETIAALDLRPATDPAPGQASAGRARPGPASARLASASAAFALPPLATGPSGIGLHLSFVDAAGGAVRSERDLRVSELFAFQVLPYFDQYALSHRFWAADSSALVLPLTDDSGLDHVVVLPADGSEPRTVATGWIGFWSP